jgi:protein phosphatase methylesterase 1
LNQDEPEDEDLSIDRLATDLVELVQVMFPEPTKASSLLVRSPTLKMYPTMTFSKLVGHSMGGSVMVLAVPLLLEKKYRITGVAVLDVVEGVFY